ncbi:MAG: SpoIVB peptidase S55 domain-containing protein, partial [bacterium]
MKLSIVFIFICAILNVITAPLFAIPNPDKSEFIFMDELEVGMIGEAHTVIEGVRIDSFTVELLGIAKDSGFNNRDFLLCKMSGEVIEKSGGVAGGMSGSPVYFSGRLAGAVSGHWGFTDQTVGIVTPIEYMLEELEFLKLDFEMEGNDAPVTAWKDRGNNSLTKATREIEIVESGEFIPATDKMVFVKASTPMYISGIEEKDLKLIEPLLNETGNQVFIVPINYPPNIEVQKSFSP